MYARFAFVGILVSCLIGCSNPQPSEYQQHSVASGRNKLPSTLSIPVCEDVPHFTDITADPIVPGGMTEWEIGDSIAQGWVDGIMIRSQDNSLMMFRNMMSGQPEWRCGTIPEGTRILKSPNGNIGIATMCRNPTGLETIKDSWFPR